MSHRKFALNSLSGAGLLVAVLLAVLVRPAAASPAGTKISFGSLDSKHPHQLSGTLYLPENPPGPVPALVLVHGTSGIDMRGEFYRASILGAGIAIFEVDFKTGIYSGAWTRPKMDTFPPMAFAALKELRKLPSIDPGRIGIMGFSMGGHVALRTAMESNRRQWMGAEKGFVACATFYPVCKAFIKDLEESGSTLTGAPIIVFYGTDDSYGDGTAVPELKHLLATKYGCQLATVEYPGATHGFDRNAPAVHFFDPAAIGRRGHMAWNPEAANDARTRVVAFLRENLVAR
ncbi:MAG TPA: dienelactone hydrolase family protein [Opitutaceae bacterium]|nr:dienelactone hydrolase family protein [Opitutaceae bacterium]